VNMSVKAKMCLPLVVTLLFGLLCACGYPNHTNTPPPDTSSGPVDRVELVYFHRAQRCHGCIYAETTTRYTVETYFADELASGKVTFEVFNVEDKENATTVDKYGAFTSSLFINTIKDGTDHIEEVTEIWFLLDDDEAFVEALRSKIEKSLKGEG